MAPRASRFVAVSEDQLQPSETLDDRGVDDVLDEGYSPPDREPAHLRHPHEVDEPETLDERLAEEEPDVSLDPDHDDDADTFGTDARGRGRRRPDRSTGRAGPGLGGGRGRRAVGDRRGHRRRGRQRRGSGDACHRRATTPSTTDVTTRARRGVSIRRDSGSVMPRVEPKPTATACVVASGVALSGLVAL